MDIILDAIKDTWLMLPILFVTYCVLEVYERKNTEYDDRMFFSLQKYGPLFGAALGLIPQCGFSILAVMLFLQNNATLGTMIAVMVATSDEAIPILLSNPAMFTTLIKLLVMKFLIAVCAGYFTDKVLFPKQKIDLFEDMMEETEENSEEVAEEPVEEQPQASGNSCPCCYPQYPLPVSAAIRAGKIYGFIFVTSVVLGFAIEWLGTETLAKILLSKSIFQPLISALVGFIPNCAVTVVLAQLFTIGSLQFGSLLAGLITNAGLGMMLLVRYDNDKRDIRNTVLILYGTAVLFGILVNIF